MKPRQRVRSASMAVLVGATVLAAYGWLIEPAWIDVTRHTVGEVSDDRLRIAQLSDLHLRSLSRTEAKTLDAVAEIAPDIVLLTGDVIDQPEALPVLDEFLARIRAPVKVAVLGNWEYWGQVPLDGLRKVYERHQVRFLVNDCLRISRGPMSLSIVGLDDHTAGRPDTRRIDPGCATDAGRLVLIQHSPGFFEDVAPDQLPRPDLSVAGHTHGGQVALMGRALWRPPGSGSFAHGHYETRWGSLYVSRGIGTSIMRFRLGSRPEIAVFDVYR